MYTPAVGGTSTGPWWCARSIALAYSLENVQSKCTPLLWEAPLQGPRGMQRIFAHAHAPQRASVHTGKLHTPAAMRHHSRALLVCARYSHAHSLHKGSVYISIKHAPADGRHLSRALVVHKGHCPCLLT
eukprot:1158712-Pelagomonas_calceolata.AAC.10